MSGVTGPELFREVTAYCARTNVTVPTFCELSRISHQTVYNLRTRFSPKRSTIDRVRGYMERNPDGPRSEAGQGHDHNSLGKDGAAALLRAQQLSIAPARPSPAAVAAAAAERTTMRTPRTVAEKSHAYVASVRRDLTPAETIASIGHETPAYTIAQVKRRWPAIWSRVVTAARKAGRTPGEMLADLIERGLAEDAA